MNWAGFGFEPIQTIHLVSHLHFPTEMGFYGLVIRS